MKLAQRGFISNLHSKSKLTCKSCILEKITKSPFVEQGKKATKLLELVHSDACGPINVMAHGLLFLEL